MSILENTSWGRRALKLIEHSINLEKDHPTVLFLRHSARDEPDNLEETLKAHLTDEGREAAYEFGLKLPQDWQYRFFSSPVQRCIDTSRKIQEGLHTNEVPYEERDVLENLTIINGTKQGFMTYFERDKLKFVDYWLSGFYPAYKVEPALHIAQRTAMDLTHNLASLTEGKMDIYVSHDFHLLVYLFSWAGILASKDWIEYIDGFFIQFHADQMHFYYNGGKKIVPYPFWWESAIQNVLTDF